jgi:hypothetical protein
MSIYISKLKAMLWDIPEVSKNEDCLMKYWLNPVEMFQEQ